MHEIKKTYRVATRPSLLATTQTKQTVALLQEKHPDITFEIIPISTHGDLVVDKPLVAFGGTGLFVKELEQALLDGKADFAIHSLKDMPGITPDEFFIAAYPKRENPCDVLLTKNNKGIADLKPGMVVGTGSPRRQLQLMKFCPNLIFKDLRGNIDTRLKKLEAGEYDAIVLAAAGLFRLGRPIVPASTLSASDCIPAVGQGAIALECKADDAETITLLQTVNHKETEIAVSAERAFMRTIGGGCKFPLAAHATIQNQTVTLNAIIGTVETGDSMKLTFSAQINEAKGLGKHMGDAMRIACEKKGISV